MCVGGDYLMTFEFVWVFFFFCPKVKHWYLWWFCLSHDLWLLHIYLLVQIRSINASTPNSLLVKKNNQTHSAWGCTWPSATWWALAIISLSTIWSLSLWQMFSWCLCHLTLLYMNLKGIPRMPNLIHVKTEASQCFDEAGLRPFPKECFSNHVYQRPCWCWCPAWS